MYRLMKGNIMSLENIIKQERELFIKEHNLKSFYRINTGKCMDFADIVKEKALNEGIEVDILSTESMYSYELDSYANLISSEMDRDKVLEYNGNIPLGMNICQLETLELQFHVFISYNNLFFDSECPEGVERILDLPFYKRELTLLEKFLTESSLIEDGKITDTGLEVITDYHYWYEEYIGQNVDEDDFEGFYAKIMKSK